MDKIYNIRKILLIMLSTEVIRQFLSLLAVMQILTLPWMPPIQFI